MIIYKKGNKIAVAVSSKMVSISVGEYIDDVWEQYDISDLPEEKQNEIYKSPSKGKKYMVKRRKVV